MNSKRSLSSSEMGDLPALYSIVKGEVVSIQPYGVFVKIPGCAKNGLVHISQLSNSRVENAGEVCEVGERVYGKVISLEPDGSKIALSMKIVNQSSGQDLDPNNVQITQDAQRKKTGFQKTIPRIELGAVYDTTCKKCGGKGHLAQDCFHLPGQKAYELIEETFAWPTRSIADDQKTDNSAVSRKEKKKKKDAKGKHKKTKKKRRDTDLSSDSSDKEEERLRKKNMKTRLIENKVNDERETKLHGSDRESGHWKTFDRKGLDSNEHEKRERPAKLQHNDLERHGDSYQRTHDYSDPERHGDNKNHNNSDRLRSDNRETFSSRHFSSEGKPDHSDFSRSRKESRETLKSPRSRSRSPVKRKDKSSVTEKSRGDKSREWTNRERSPQRSRNNYS